LSGGGKSEAIMTAWAVKCLHEGEFLWLPRLQGTATKSCEYWQSDLIVRVFRPKDTMTAGHALSRLSGDEDCTVAASLAPIAGVYFLTESIHVCQRASRYRPECPAGLTPTEHKAQYPKPCTKLGYGGSKMEADKSPARGVLDSNFARAVSGGYPCAMDRYNALHVVVWLYKLNPVYP
jgi:hypothetical protein